MPNRPETVQRKPLGASRSDLSAEVRPVAVAGRDLDPAGLNVNILDEDEAPSEEYLRGARALLTGLLWGEVDA